MKKTMALLLSVLFSIVGFAGCSVKTLEAKLEYIGNGPTEGVVNPEFDRNLFYRNDLTTIAADPSAVYVTSGSEAGYFYMYATSDEIGTSGYQCWRSKDLVTWERRGVAFVPKRDSWSIHDFWAPEVIYDKELDTYFLYYTATDRNNGVKSLGLATSKTPYGPFEQYVDEEKGITLNTPLFDFTKMSDEDPLTEKNADGKKVPMKVIDACPFMDPKTQEKYLYFVHDLGASGIANEYKQSSIYVIKMTDWYTPDFTQVKKLTEPNRATPDGEEDKLKWLEGIVNEGPYMYFHENKYFLMLSVNTFTDKSYALRTAVSDSPMGPFKKLTKEEGGFMLGADMMWDHASGTGHHSFAQAGDELFAIYHAHIDRHLGGGLRAIAGDRVLFVENKDGLSVPYVNGPTYSPQPLPTEVSGYTNLAPQAQITATNTAEGSDVKYLNDKIIQFHDYAGNEYKANGGTSVITLKFEDYVTTSAVMVYNSYNYALAFDNISKIEFDFKNKGTAGVAYTDKLHFDWATYATTDLRMRPGGSFIVEYADMEVKEIRITVNNKDAFAISDIVVLGK